MFGGNQQAALESIIQALTESFGELKSRGSTIEADPARFARGFANIEDATQFELDRQRRKDELWSYEPSQTTKIRQEQLMSPVKEFAGETYGKFRENNPNAAESFETFFSDPRVGHALGATEFMIPSAGRGVKGFMDKPDIADAPSFMEKQRGAINLLGDETIEPRILQTASTRIPSKAQQIKQGINAHTRDDLLVNPALYSPEKFQQGVDLMREYPAFRNLSSDPAEAYGTMMEVMSENLKGIIDRMPTEWREKSMDWYRGYNRLAQDAAKKHNATPEQSAGIIAVLSPQTEWNMNLSRADRIMDTWNTRQDFKWDEKMDAELPALKKSIKVKKYADKIDNVRNKRLNELKSPAEKAIWIRAYDQAHNPREFHTYEPTGKQGGIAMTKNNKKPRQGNWASTNSIEKAVQILEDGSMENISTQLGDNHKVRSFFRNASDYEDPNTATIDTHAVATDILMPYGASAKPVAQNFGSGLSDATTGMRGTYPMHQQAYNIAARDLGIPARQVQSPTWDFGRVMMEGKKGKAYKDAAEDIWTRQASGEITQQQAIDLIIKAFGMPENPF